MAEAVIDDEAAFRAIEERIVLDALDESGAVVAVGSGALASQKVRDALVTVRVVWLELGLVDAARRTGLSEPAPCRWATFGASCTTCSNNAPRSTHPWPTTPCTPMAASPPRWPTRSRIGRRRDRDHHGERRCELPGRDRSRIVRTACSPRCRTGPRAWQ